MSIKQVLLKFVSCVVMLSAVAGIAHAQSTLDVIQKRGKVLIAIDLGTAPYGFTDAQLKPMGVDVEVAGLIAAGLGVPLEIVPVTGPTRIPYLLTNKVDLVVSTFSITPERARTISFSNPYAASEVIVVAAKNKKITSSNDLASKTIGVVRGATQDTHITRTAPKNATVRRFEDDATAAAALLSGQVDALATGSVIANELIKKSANRPLEIKYVIAQSTYSIGIRKDDQEFLHWLNTTIYYNRMTGELAKIHEKFIGGKYPELSSF